MENATVLAQQRHAAVFFGRDLLCDTALGQPELHPIAEQAPGVARDANLVAAAGGESRRKRKAQPKMLHLSPPSPASAARGNVSDPLSPPGSSMRVRGWFARQKLA